jgi:hypothetical protein
MVLEHLRCLPPEDSSNAEREIICQCKQSSILNSIQNTKSNNCNNCQ